MRTRLFHAKVSLTKLGEGTKEEEIPISQSRRSSSTGPAQCGSAASNQEILELFKGGILYDRVDHKDESWANATPESTTRGLK